MENIPKVYAAYSIDDFKRIQSSSGGVFSVIAENILNSYQGVVYGVAMSDDCYSAEYIRITKESDLCKLRGSKYMQANIGESFAKVKTDLESGLNVLFTGTGCIINGLKLFLGKEYGGLFCVDVVCHGVPSPALWKKYVLYQEKKHGKLIKVNFRCKDKGWEEFGLKENSLFISKSKDPFFKMFLRNYCLRPSCYDCIAKSDKRSDISLADFWGIGKVLPEMNDNKGISLVLVRTEKGQKLFNECVENIKYQNVDYAKAVSYNPAEYRSSARPDERDDFFVYMNSLEFEELSKKYLAETLKDKMRGKVADAKRIIKKILNRIIIRGGNNKHDTNMDYGILYTYEKDR